MTANLPAQTDGDHPVMAPVTFILAGPRLVTVRFHEPRAFVTFPLRASRVNLGCGTGEAVLVALLEAIIDRLADVLERTGREIDDRSEEHTSELQSLMRTSFAVFRLNKTIK